MGIFSGFKLASGVAGSNVLPFPRRSHTVGIASPWSTSDNLEQLLANDLGIPFPVNVSRRVAVRIPSIAKGRALLHSVIATRPLRAFSSGGVPLPEQPTWLYRSDTGIAPRMRTKLILDDILFNEASLLFVARGAGDAILDAVHVAYDRWSVNDRGVILIDDKPVSPEQVIWIPGPGPGLLVQGCELIPAALATDRAWAQRVRNPFPAMVIQHNEDVQLEDDERTAMVEAVAAARRNIDGAVMYVPFGLEVESHAAETTDLFESGRNALRLDFANMLNMPASALDGSVAEASLTYSTQEGRRNDFLDLSVPFWAGPIEDALSLDNVVPRGQYIRFDFADLITSAAAPTGPNVED